MHHLYVLMEFALDCWLEMISGRQVHDDRCVLIVVLYFTTDNLVPLGLESQHTLLNSSFPQQHTLCARR